MTASKNRNGLTLVEVVAAMALLGGLLVSVVLATSRLTTQSHLTDKRIEAYRLADNLLTQWWGDLETIPRDESGVVEGYENWQWQTTVRDAENENFEAEILKLEIQQVDVKPVTLASVEILLAVETEEETEETEEDDQEEPTTRPDTD